MGRERKAYEEMVNDRPAKFQGDDVDYREADRKNESCGRCLHFLIRQIDQFGVCDIVRLVSEEPIEEDHTCDYFTKDGEVFPLL